MPPKLDKAPGINSTKAKVTPIAAAGTHDDTTLEFGKESRPVSTVSLEASNPLSWAQIVASSSRSSVNPATVASTHTYSIQTHNSENGIFGHFSSAASSSSSSVRPSSSTTHHRTSNAMNAVSTQSTHNRADNRSHRKRDKSGIIKFTDDEWEELKLKHLKTSVIKDLTLPALESFRFFHNPSKIDPCAPWDLMSRMEKAFYHYIGHMTSRKIFGEIWFYSVLSRLKLESPPSVEAWKYWKHGRDVGSVAVLCGDEMLVVNNVPNGGYTEGVTTWPAGRFEPSDHTTWEGACREMREEIGLDLDYTTTRPSIAWTLEKDGRTIYNFVVFLTSKPEIQVVDTTELSACYWAPINAIHGHNYAGKYKFNAPGLTGFARSLKDLRTKLTLPSQSTEEIDALANRPITWKHFN